MLYLKTYCNQSFPIIPIDSKIIPKFNHYFQIYGEANFHEQKFNLIIFKSSYLRAAKFVHAQKFNLIIFKSSYLREAKFVAMFMHYNLVSSRLLNPVTILYFYTFLYLCFA